MVQFHTSGWLHRAVWGEGVKIPFGKPDTTEKVSMGPLPKAAEWVRLEIDPAKLGLKAGTKITGYAFTQSGGTVFWDKLGAARTVDPAKDPAWSLAAWIKQNQGKRVEGLPGDLQVQVRSKKPEEWTEPEKARLRSYWLENFNEGLAMFLVPSRQNSLLSLLKRRPSIPPSRSPSSCRTWKSLGTAL